MVAAISLTRIALIREEWRPAPHYWKFPGGGVETEDGTNAISAVVGARRELYQETGIWALLDQITLCRGETRTARYGYLPTFCLAEVTEYQMDAHAEMTYEDWDDLTRPTLVQVFPLGSVAKMEDLHPNHRMFASEIERTWRSVRAGLTP